MRCMINSSRDRIEKYTKEVLKIVCDSKLSEVPEQALEQDVVYLARPSLRDNEIDFLRAQLKLDHELTIVCSDGVYLQERQDVHRFVEIMAERSKAEKVRKQERNKVVQSEPPARLTVEPSILCNLKCPHCSTGLRILQRDSRHINPEIAKSVIRQTEGKSLALTLPHEGEPFIHPEIVFDIAREAKQLYMNVDVATNGHYFSEQVLERILDHRIDSITVTIDGMTEETYTKYRTGGSLKKVTDGLKKLSEMKKERGWLTPHIRVQMIMMRHNIHEYPKLKEFAREIGADSHGLKTMALINFDQKEEWLPEDRSKIRKRYHFDREEEYQVKFDTEYDCRVPWENIWINSDGKILGCTFDWQSQYAIDQIDENTNLMELWNCTGYLKFREQLLEGINKAPLCKARCKGDFDTSHLEIPD